MGATAISGLVGLIAGGLLLIARMCRVYRGVVDRCAGWETGRYMAGAVTSVVRYLVVCFDLRH